MLHMCVTQREFEKENFEKENLKKNFEKLGVIYYNNLCQKFF